MAGALRVEASGRGTPGGGSVLSFLRALRILLEMIKFEHTVFALPFALMGAILAGDRIGHAHGWPPGRTLGWILVAMVGARTAAMAFNRIVDADYDAANPRTAGRALPAGLVKPWQAAALTAAGAALLVLAAASLNRLCLALSPLALAATLGYSFTKRITVWTHLILGASIGIAPVGAWLGVTGAFGGTPLLLWLAVALWIGGFDVLYALQDMEVDRKLGIRSLPARLGAARSLTLARVMHLGMLAVLGGLGIAAGLGLWYYAGLVVAALLLGYEHRIIAPDDLSRLNTAFFTLNGWLSVVLFLFLLVDRW